MIVPHRELSPEALAGVVEEYVTRDGTEQTDAEAKAAAVVGALDRGELVLVYDPATESCNIVSREQLEGAPSEEPTVDTPESDESFDEQ